MCRGYPGGSKRKVADFYSWGSDRVATAIILGCHCLSCLDYIIAIDHARIARTSFGTGATVIRTFARNAKFIVTEQHGGPC